MELGIKQKVSIREYLYAVTENVVVKELWDGLTKTRIDWCHSHNRVLAFCLDTCDDRRVTN